MGMSQLLVLLTLTVFPLQKLILPRPKPAAMMLPEWAMGPSCNKQHNSYYISNDDICATGTIQGNKLCMYLCFIKRIESVLCGIFESRTNYITSIGFFLVINYLYHNQIQSNLNISYLMRQRKNFNIPMDLGY